MHRRRFQHEDRDPQITLEEALQIAVVGLAKYEVLVLTDMMDALHQPIDRTSTDAQSVFVMIIAL